MFSKFNLDGISLENMLELIINNRNYLGKKFDDVNECEKLFFDINYEKIYIIEKFNEFN